MNETVQPFSGRLLFGVVLLSLGLLWTADNLGFTHASQVLRWWPVLLVAFGVARLTGWGAERRIFVGAVCTLVGALLLGHEAGWVRAGLGLVFPIAMVALGVEILMRGARASDSAGVVGVGDGADHVRSFALMGAASTRSTSQSLRGAELSAFLGGVELDLREARPADGRVVVDAFAFMGGIDIVVPANWRVEFHATPVIGGMQDMRAMTPAGPDSATVVVRGVVILGGLQVCDEPTGRTVRVGVSRMRRDRYERWKRFERDEDRRRQSGDPASTREARVDPVAPGATAETRPTEPR